MNEYPIETAQQEALKFLQRLASDNGAIVSSNSCPIEAIEQARLDGRFFVDNEGFGYIFRPKGWLNLAEESIRDQLHCKELDEILSQELAKGSTESNA